MQGFPAPSSGYCRYRNAFFHSVGSDLSFSYRNPNCYRYPNLDNGSWLVLLSPSKPRQPE